MAQLKIRQRNNVFGRKIHIFVLVFFSSILIVRTCLYFPILKMNHVWVFSHSFIQSVLSKQLKIVQMLAKLK